MSTKTRDALREQRVQAERRWRRMRRLPRVCGIVVLAAIVLLSTLPFFRLGPFAPIVSGLITLLCVLAMMTMNILHRSAFMAVQKSRGVSAESAERAYVHERPFASAA